MAKLCVKIQKMTGYCFKKRHIRRHGKRQMVEKKRCRWHHTLLCLRSALATHSNCLSPTEKFSPFSVTSECRERGNWLTYTQRALRKSTDNLEISGQVHFLYCTTAP